MPTLFRLLFVLGALAGLVFGIMTAMVTFIHPEPREITQTIALPSTVK